MFRCNTNVQVDKRYQKYTSVYIQVHPYDKLHIHYIELMLDKYSYRFHLLNISVLLDNDCYFDTYLNTTHLPYKVNLEDILDCCCILEHKSFRLCRNIQIHNNSDHPHKYIDNFHQNDKCNHLHIESLKYISIGKHHQWNIFDLKNNPSWIDISSSTIQDHYNYQK